MKFFPALAAGAAFVSVAVPTLGIAAEANDAELLDRMSHYVERYYMRAQTLVATETVVVQPLARDMSNSGFARHIVSEVRIEWDPAKAGEPQAIRQLISARGPSLGPPEQPDCLDPRSFTPEPLAFLLPTQRHRFRFSIGRTDAIAGVQTRRIDYNQLTREPPVVDWRGRCGMVRSAGPTRGRLWVDPASGEILRFDEHLAGLVELPGPPVREVLDAPRTFTMERSDTTIDYRRIPFTEPDETLVLPVRVDSITVIRNSGEPRVRLTITFTNYRRFLTAGRILPIQ